MTALVVWALGWLYLITHLIPIWWNDPLYGHGFFVPVFCCVILWMRKCEWWKVERTKDSLSGDRMLRFLFITAACLVLPTELMAQILPGGRVMIWGCALYNVWVTLLLYRVLFQKRIPGIVFGGLLLMMTAIPWPSALEYHLVEKMKMFLMKLVVEVLNLSGILARAQGNLIELPSGYLNVAEACSGIRSLQSSIMVSVALGLIFRLNRWRFVILVGWGILLSLLGNLIRTLVLSFITALYGVKMFELIHDPTGWTILALVIIGVYSVAGKWGVWVGRAEPMEWVEPAWKKVSSYQGVVILQVSLFAVAHIWFWMAALNVHHPNEPYLVYREKPGIHLTKLEVPEEMITIMQPNQWKYYRGTSMVGGSFTLYDFFWNSGGNILMPFFHRPDICVTGSGWKKVGDVRRIPIMLDGRKTEWNLFEFASGENRLLQAWGVWSYGEEVELDFEEGWTSLWRQQKQRWLHIWHGRKSADAQIVSVVVDANVMNQQDLEKLIQTLLRTNPVYL